MKKLEEAALADYRRFAADSSDFMTTRRRMFMATGSEQPHFRLGDEDQRGADLISGYTRPAAHPADPPRPYNITYWPPPLPPPTP